MSKSRNYDREFTQNDRLKKENSELKREVAKLRKMISSRNLSSEQIKNPKELAAKQAKEAKNSVKTKKDWTCFECARGTMKLTKIPRRDGDFYLRACTNLECGHKTKIKKYTDDVEQS